MRAYQFLPEIERIASTDYEGGKPYLDLKGRAKKLRSLPGGSGLLYTVSGKQDVVVRLWDPSAGTSPQNIAKLTLSPLTNFPLRGALQVDTITVDEEYRGQGLAKALYGIVLSILKRPLVAGYAQTPGGRANWVSLSRIPGVETKGYVSLHDDAIKYDSNTDNRTVDRRIDVIMGKLGGQYMGKSPNGQHYFSFDVAPNTSGRELKAWAQQNLARVYDEGFDVTTGLYATWSGAKN